MNRLFFLFLAVFFCALSPLTGATPFTEQTVRMQEISGSDIETINRTVRPDSRGFPVTGSVAGCNRLRLRSWPWGKVIGNFNGGATLNVLGVSGEFYYVEINGQKGYMHKNYVSLPGAPASGEAPYYPGDTRNGGYLPLNDGLTASTSGTATSDDSTASTSPAPAATTPSAPTGQAVTTRSPDFKKWFDNAVSQYASQWAFPAVTNKYGNKVTVEDFMKAIIFIESSGVHRSAGGKLTTSHCGAMGFMQLMPRTAQSLGVDATDPAQNLIGGAKYFKEVFKSRYVGKKSGIDKIVMAGCAYNMGPYSTRLAGSFADMVKARAGAVGYGLKVKMCLGLALTDLERAYVKEKMAGARGVDAYADQLYSSAHGLGA